jgi:hypothetical protein
MKAPLIPGLAVMFLAAAVPAAAARQRFALVAGANDGGGQRPRLKYAVSDADRFARVLRDLGGVEPADAVLLKQPSLKELDDALAALGARMASARSAGGEGVRIEVLLYYSGHADETGLLLAGDRYSYRTLRDRMDALPADVRIAVLDACASGAITRLKGGQSRPPFLVDASSSMRGHAFLTSSSAEETAQESDRIGASYFTHYLVSGLRGAADASGEGTVTLGEAYQFAFRETLGRTVETRGGAQHPSYDISLSGTGDVVMTDLRGTSAGLVLDEGLGGRCLVREAGQGPVVELLKVSGRRVELGLAPGRYEVHCQDRQGAMVARPVLQEGKRIVLGPADFTGARRDPTMARGGGDAAVGWLNGRSRFELRHGWRHGARTAGGVPDEDSTGDAGLGAEVSGLVYTRWLRPNLSLSLAASGIGGEARSVIEPDGVFLAESSSVTSVLAGVRRDLVGRAAPARLRPYVSVGVGLCLRKATASREQTLREVLPSGAVFTTSSGETIRHTAKALAGQLGAGLDYQVSRRVMAGASVRYDLMPDFDALLLGGPWRYRGLEVGLGLSWVFGKAAPPKP